VASARYLLACHFTPSYRAQDVTAALDAARAEAERWHGPLAKTPFLVTDNGSSFLARHFQAHIDGQYSHVHIQCRTPTQLGLLERFHQTLKTEEVYWQLYRSPGEARASLEVFRRRYNDVRPHWALVPIEGGDPVTPKGCVRSRTSRPITEMAGLGQSGPPETRGYGSRCAFPYRLCRHGYHCGYLSQ
jgi:transposase InsO family protein